MTAQLIDGKKISQQRIEAVAQAVKARQEKGLHTPCLAVVLVGDDPASAVYVRNKKLACQKSGIESRSYELPSETTQDDLLKLVDELNGDSAVDGILVQLPLPAHIDSQAVLERIVPHKDVDGFHPYNVGRLVVKMPLMRPCTPKGVMTLLEAYGIDPKGKKAVIVGASNIVGRPQALELLLSRATVTICHSATQTLPMKLPPPIFWWSAWAFRILLKVNGSNPAPSLSMWASTAWTTAACAATWSLMSPKNAPP